MPTILQIVKIIIVLIASITLGNWFMTEFRSARVRKKPWYAVYLSPPGLLILLAVTLPLLVWLIGRF
ncbi:MAG: hypothetical protein ACOWWM_05560 [Desulfobacterales bacterium]